MSDIMTPWAYFTITSICPKEDVDQLLELLQLKTQPVMLFARASIKSPVFGRNELRSAHCYSVWGNFSGWNRHLAGRLKHTYELIEQRNEALRAGA